MHSIEKLKKALESNAAPMDYKFALAQVDEIIIKSDLILGLMKDIDLEKTHRFSPCYYCGEYHDSVKVSNCSGVGLIQSDDLIDNLYGKMKTSEEYWYKCGLQDAINIIKYWILTRNKLSEQVESTHSSDCAIYNEPAMSKGDCNCMAKA